MDTLELISFINTRYGTTFHLLHKLPGGCHGGAYNLQDDAGQRAVLKHSLFSPGAVAVVAQLRAVGYPTPATLYTGTTPDGTPYWVSEFVPGKPLKALPENYLDQVLDLNDLQANLNLSSGPANATNWSEDVYNVVFDDGFGWSSLLRTHSPQIAQFMVLLEAWARPFAGKSLPNTDIVHGDFALPNILAQDGRITGVVDTAFAGYGTRVTDLATLWHYAYLYNYGDTVRVRLHTRIRQIADAATVTICLAHRIIAMLAWAIEHDPPGTAELYMSGSGKMLDNLL